MNEEVIGTGIFDEPQRRADAMLALETWSIALSGPYRLYQGGFGLVARNPVFLTNGAGRGAALLLCSTWISTVSK